MTPLSLRRDGEVAELVIDRADKRNAMALEMWAAIPELVAEVDADDAVKVLVLRGEGPHFCAGADIGEFRERRATPEAARAYGDVVEAATDALSGLAKPSIAAIRGFCIGGGCELALSCDLRVAEAGAEFAITPAKLGIVYAFGSTRRLVAAVGPSAAKDILLTAERFDAAEAHRIHLVDRLVDDRGDGRVDGGGLEEAVRGLAATICSRSQVSVRGGKRLVDKVAAGADEPDAEARDIPLDAVSSDDYAEGVSAFLEKRAPRFGGP